MKRCWRIGHRFRLLWVVGLMLNIITPFGKSGTLAVCLNEASDAAIGCLLSLSTATNDVSFDATLADLLIKMMLSLAVYISVACFSWMKVLAARR